MKKKLILSYLLLMFSVLAFAQCDFYINTKSVGTSCDETNGIIEVKTNAILPTFTWSNGLKDSIGLNLSAGLYTILVRDNSGCEQSVSVYLSSKNGGPLHSNPDASFSYEVKNNGYVQFLNTKQGVEQSWTFGDGNTERGLNPVHQYINNDVFEVCHFYKNVCGSDTVCKNVLVEVKQKQVEFGKSSIKLPNVILPSGFTTNYVCECNNKMFLIGDYPYLIFALDLANESIVQLPVTSKRSFYGSFYGSFRYNRGFICKDNLLYFGGNDGVLGNELYKSDGTVAGTQLVGDNSTGPYSSNPSDFFIHNNTLYFFAYKSVSGSSIGYTYSYDGANINEVAFAVYNEAEVLNGKIIYKSSPGIVRAVTNVGDTPTVLRNIPECFSCNFENVGIINGNILFYSYDNTNGFELWKTDGTIQGTSLIKDINPGANSSQVYAKGVYYNGYIYFTADNGTNGIELWKSDGTTLGTTMVKDINIGSASSSPGSLTVMDNLLFFSAETAAYGREIWKSDGTTNGTVMLYDGYPNANSHLSYLTSSFVNDGVNLYYGGQASGVGAGLMRANKNSTQYTIVSLQNYNCTPDNGGELFKTSTNKMYYTAGYSEKWISKICDYQKPFLNDTLLTYPSDYNVSTLISLKALGVSNATYKWYVNQDANYCSTNIPSTSQTYSFNKLLGYGIPNVYVRAFTQEGCPSPAEKVNFSIKYEPEMALISLQRCNSNKVIFKVSFPKGKFYIGNEFKAYVYGLEIPLVEVPMDFDGLGTFTVTLPNGVPDIQGPNYYFIKITSSNPSKNALFITIPSVTQMNLSLYKNNTINEGQLVNLYLSMGNDYPLPYSFKINDKIYENILQDPFRISITPNESKKYIISDFRNTCSNDLIERNSAIIKVKKPCVSVIEHIDNVGSYNYYAQNTINSQGKIENGGIVEYNSGKVLNLNPGFSIAKGAYFKAEIINCD